MKKYLLKVALFLALAALTDLAAGLAFAGLRRAARSGQTFTNEYLSRRFRDDILVLGSSRAKHHYAPAVLEVGLGLSCYNAGEMGCGIVQACARFRMAVRNHKPQLVLYELTPQYDYLQEGPDYSASLGVIRQYAGDPAVRDVYLSFSDKLEPLRLLSQMYRNNSKLMVNLRDALLPPDGNKGFAPLPGHLHPGDEVYHEPQLRIDSLKLGCLERLISEAKAADVPLYLLVSPLYNGAPSPGLLAPARELCARYGVPLLDNTALEGIAGNPDCFVDAEHLSQTGAAAYSKVVVELLRQALRQAQGPPSASSGACSATGP